MSPAYIYFIAECPTLRVQQGSNQKCYVRISFPFNGRHYGIYKFFRIVDALAISLVIVKMGQLATVVSLLVHLLQVVRLTRRLYHPSSATVVEVQII